MTSKKMPPKVKKNSTEKLLQIRGKLAKLLKLEEAVALKYESGGAKVGHGSGGIMLLRAE